MKSGLILLNKKPGITSFDALKDIKSALGTGKAGHTGTLDKFASGLLLVLTGRALKLSQWFSHCDKQYLGKIHFGAETDTLDPEGKITAKAAVPPREKVQQVLGKFTGVIAQIPPVYSAVHINGRRAFELARSGKTPEMKERKVTIYKLELRSWEPPFADIFVHCSSGTYIRSLARDIALAAESRGYLESLVRTQVAGFTLEMSGRERSSLRPIDKSVISSLGLPWFEISSNETEQVIHGKPLEPILEGKRLFPEQESSAENTDSVYTAVFCGEELAAVVKKTGGKWKYGCVCLDFSGSRDI
jgi:tRNA pseudouridine55 synthase